MVQIVDPFKQPAIRDPFREQEAVDPNEGMGLGSRLITGVGRSADKAGRGFLDMQLGIADKLTGGWQWPEQIREQLQADSRDRDRLWKDNADPVMRGAELGTDILQFFPGASAATKLTQGAKMIPRALSQAAGAMGLDAVHQKGEGQEGIDAGRTAMTGAFAGGAEFMAPIAARLGKAGVRAIRQRIGLDDPVALGRELAKQAGLEGVTDDVARKIAASADEIEAGARPGAVVAEQEFGFRPTRAQKTGDFADASREDLLRQAGNRRIRSADEFNQNRLEQVVGEVTGGLDSPQTAVDDIQQAVRGARETAKAGEREAWQFARGSDLVASGQLADDFSARVANRLQSEGRIVTDNIAPQARDVIRAADDVLRRSPDGAVDFNQIQETRRIMTAAQGSVTDPSSKAAIGIAKREFDAALDDLTEATILSGDPQDIQRLKDAIGVSRGVFQKFSARGKNDQVGKMVENIIENGNLDKLSDAVLGSAEVSSSAGVNFARAVKRTLGDDAAQLDQVRQAVLLKAMTRKTGDVAGMQRIVSNMKTLMNKRRDLMGELFNEREISQLSRMTAALDDMSRKPGNIGRDSGTTGRAIRYLNQVAGDGFLGFIPRMLAGLSDRAAARAATSPLRTSPALPALPATAGGYGSTQSTPP